MRLHCLRRRRRIEARFGSRVVGCAEPFGRRSGNALAHRSHIPGFQDRRLKGFCTSIRVMNAVVQSAPVHGGEYLLLLCMARYAADDGTRVFPSVGTLAKDSRQNERTVQKQLRSLEAKGLIQRVGNSKHGTNDYTIVIHIPLAVDHPPKERGAALDADRGALECKTPALRPPESSSNTSKNHQEHLEAISKFLPQFKSAYRGKQ